MANTYYRNGGKYRGYDDRRRRQSTQHTNNYNVPKDVPIDLPPVKDTPPQGTPDTAPNTSTKDTPPVRSHQNLLNGLLQNGPITSLINVNARNIDKDKLIILVLIYLLYKDGKQNLKLILALGYILI